MTDNRNNKKNKTKLFTEVEVANCGYLPSSASVLQVFITLSIPCLQLGLSFTVLKL